MFVKIIPHNKLLNKSSVSCLHIIEVNWVAGVPSCCHWQILKFHCIHATVDNDMVLQYPATVTVWYGDAWSNSLLCLTNFKKDKGLKCRGFFLYVMSRCFTWTKLEFTTTQLIRIIDEPLCSYKIPSHLVQMVMFLHKLHSSDFITMIWYQTQVSVLFTHKSFSFDVSGLCNAFLFPPSCYVTKECSLFPFWCLKGFPGAMVFYWVFSLVNFTILIYVTSRMFWFVYIISVTSSYILKTCILSFTVPSLTV